MLKTFTNTSAAEARKRIRDLQIVGDGDAWQLLCKASSAEQEWMKSTKAMEIQGAGCLVQVTTQQGPNIAEAVTFVPGVFIATYQNGGHRLVAIPDAPTAPPPPPAPPAAAADKSPSAPPVPAGTPPPGAG